MRTILPESENPLLREIAHDIPVSDIGSKRIKNLIAEMRKLLTKEEYGVALAAPQVGESLNLFIVSGKALARGARNSPDEPTKTGDLQRMNSAPSAQGVNPRPISLGPRSALGRDQVYINPKILKVSRAKTSKHEGCLSVRGKWGTVPRAEKATVRAYDERGMLFTRGASGFLAHIFQHEMDHLNGILYTDKTTALHDEKTNKED